MERDAQFSKRIAALLCGLAGIGAFSVCAQQFPSRPVRLIVPYPPGGGSDVIARILAPKMGEALGQQVVIDNRAGAATIIGLDMLAKSPPDGYTIGITTSTLAVNSTLNKSLPFDTLKDFAPVSKLASFDLVIAVAEGSRFKSFAEMLAYGRANPGKLNIGTPQVGTTQNLAAELFLSTAGLQAQIVPFNGTPPVITALRGGSLDAMLDILGPVMPQIKSNALRPLAMLSEKRALNLPEVPTVQEAGGSLSKFYVGSWNGLAVPAKTPRDVVQRLSREIQLVMEMPEVKKRLSEVNLYAQGSTPEQAADILAQDVRRWGDVITKAKIDKQ